MELFIDKLLNGINPLDFLVYFTMAIFGFVFSVFGELFKHKTYNLKEWFQKEKYRIVLNLFAIIIGIIFTEDISGVPINLWQAFISGMATDLVIDRFFPKKTTKIIKN